VVFAGGERHGYNTDVPGMVAALAEAGVTAPSGATILGAGTTACAALAALRATGLASAIVLVRNPARAGDLVAAAGRLGMEVDLRPFDSEVRDGDLLVPTVPAGAADFYAERAGGSALAPPRCSTWYTPPWPTPLAQAAAKSGAVVVSGFDPLLHHAARQVELMTGLNPAPWPPGPLAHRRRSRTHPPRHLSPPKRSFPAPALTTVHAHAAKSGL
jgi:shikimate dehydrogenase